MRLTGTEETRDPDTNLAGDIRVFRRVYGFAVTLEELAKVAVEFIGDDELVQFLPDGLFVQLIGFDDAVDGASDVFSEEFSNLHGVFSVDQSERPVIPSFAFSVGRR